MSLEGLADTSHQGLVRVHEQDAHLRHGLYGSVTWPGGPGGAAAPKDTPGRQAEGCWIAPSLQGFGPTGRTNVQNSTNRVGLVALPSTTWPVASSTT